MAIDFSAANKPEAAPVAPATVPAIIEVDPTTLSLAPIRTALEVYDGPIQEMTRQAEALVVDSPGSNLAAVEMAGRVKRFWKALEEGRTRFTKPANEFVKGINGLAKAYQARFTDIENTLKAKISQHQARVELERRKAEEEARKATVELQAKLDAEAKKAGVASVKIDQLVIPKPDPVTRTESGTAYQRTTWEFEIEDPDKVPVEYKVVDDRLIRAAIKNGVREIPGVRIYQKTQTQIRS